MRITPATLTRQIIYDITKVTERIADNQRKVASGKRIERPSDDPVAIPQLLSLKTDMAAMRQYKVNMTAAEQDLTVTGAVLTKVEDALLAVNALAAQGVSDLSTPAERVVLSDQINQYLEDIVMFANENWNSRFVFGGTQTGTAPFIAARDAQGAITAVSQNPAGISGQQQRLIGPQQSMIVNSDGSAVFQPNGSGAAGDVFAAVIAARDAVAGGDTAAVKSAMTSLDDALHTVLRENAAVGTKINRLQFAGQRIELALEHSTAQRSTLEDTDYIEALMNYQMQQNIYQTALRAGAQLLQNSLLNYI